MSRYKKGRRSLVTPQGAFVLAVVTVVVLVAFMLRGMGQRQQEAITVVPDSVGDLHAVVLPGRTPNVPVEYTGFEVGFNPVAHQPNYAVWTLTAERTDGPVDRKGHKFAIDPSVPGCALPEDYRKSGFDRGHMVPAADMKWDVRAMADCHYMTNISPQDNGLNAGAWARLEGLERKWAKKYGRVVIVAGPVLSDRLSRTIGASEVAVPERFFKVLLAPDSRPPMGIGFIMPNGYVEGGVQQVAVSIDQVEAVTGMDFFSALPDEIENDVESQISFHQWNLR